jgi:hypothetical protein
MNHKIAWMVALLSCICPTAQSEAALISTYAEYDRYGPNQLESSTAMLGAIVSTVTGDSFSDGMASAYADTNGNLSVSTAYDGRGYDGLHYLATASFTEQYTNTSAHGLDYYLDFSIAQYLQNIYASQSGGLGAGTRAEIEILLNGSSIWDSSTFLYVDNGGWTAVTDTDLLTTIINDSIYGPSQPIEYDPVSVQLVGAYENEFFLGSLDPGEMFTLEYIISSRAGNYDMGYASNIFGVSGNVSYAVPEPSSLILMGIGLAGLGFVRRKETKQ